MPKKAQIFHFSSFGKRQEKYDKLNNSRLDDVKWEELELKEPYYFFVPKDFEAEEKYNEGFSVSDIFNINSNGIETGKDKLIVLENKNDLELLRKNFIDLFENELLDKYNVKIDKIQQVKGDIQNSQIIDFYYRPFDKRMTLYSENSQGVLWRPRNNVMKHFFKDNLGLFVKRQAKQDFSYAFCGKYISESCVFESAYAKTQVFPLYLYQENKLENKEEKVPNFNMEVIEKIEEKLNLKLNSDFSPEDLFDYIYAVLHSKTYRETYKEFLKIDFPKVSFDCNKETFFKLLELGRELRSYHLMENENLVPKNFITTYPVDGDNEVGKIKFEVDKTPGASSKNKLLDPMVEEKDVNGKVFINDTQYFDGIPKEVFEFYIGGYQPAQKWLKDRKGIKLGYEDILHYSKIILCLKETINIMLEIEKVFIYKNTIN